MAERKIEMEMVGREGRREIDRERGREREIFKIYLNYISNFIFS